MKKKTLFFISLIIAIFLAGAFVFTGCGSSTEDVIEDSEHAESSEDIEDIEEEPDPFIDGMTLEEAKEWQGGSVFIMNNDIFYPLLPASNMTSSVGVPKREEFDEEKQEFIEYGPLVTVWPEYASYKLPVLSKDEDLVEVQKEDESDGCTRLTGESGWAVPCFFNFEYYYNSFDDKEYFPRKTENWTHDGLPCTEIPDDVEVRSINGKEIDFSRLENVLKEICDANHFTEEDLDIHMNTDWEKVYENTAMKPVVNGNDTSTAILDGTKNQEFEISYREQDSVDTETAIVYADCRYFNLPAKLEDAKPVTHYENKYSETENGYSIIDTENFEPGIYIYGELSRYTDNVNIFKVE